MKIKLLLWLLIFVFQSQAQNQSNIWHFGYNASLDFNSGVPVALSGSAIHTNEGCASISDAAGQLLFYTDGTYVYNKMHQVMPNGSGLLGNFSSTQSAVVTPKPGSNSIYYVFTVPDYEHNDGLRYSEVDMVLNGGLGDVTETKNIHLITPVSEKVTAVQKTNGIDYWVVTHSGNSNKYVAYSITENGVDAIPVVSAVGPSVDYEGQKSGYMKFSPSGNKILYAANDQGVQLLDFNDDTGAVSNPLLVANYFANYGVEFSPSGEIAYVTTGDGYVTKLFQYDLTDTDIPSSETLLFSTNDNNTELGALQLAPDGKIYLSIFFKNYLGAINDPDILGAGCNFILNSVSLGSGMAMGGLPQFIQSYFNVNISFKNICLGESTEFSLSGSQNITSVHWDFGDGATSTEVNPSHQYSSPGTFAVSVSAVGPKGLITKDKNVTISLPPLGNTITDKKICGYENIPYTLSGNNVEILGGQDTEKFNVSYFISEADAENHLHVLPDNYSLPIGETTFHAKIYNKQNKDCSVITSFAVNLSFQPSLGPIRDYILCENFPYDHKEQFDLSTKNIEVLNGQTAAAFTISYHASQENADNDSNALSTLYTNEAAQQQIYVRIENNVNKDCFSTGSFKLVVVEKPEINAVADFIVCDDSTNDGITSFDLSLKSEEILGGYSPTGFEVKYFLTEDDAISNSNALIGNYTNVINNQTVYVSLSSIGNSQCRDVTSFKLIVSASPQVNDLLDLRMCTEDSKAVFDLEKHSALMLENLPTNQFRISYHTLLADAILGNNPLPLLYENINSTDILFVRVENTTNIECYSIKTLKIIVDTLPQSFKARNMFECETAYGNKTATFSLKSKDNEILGNLPASEFTVSYYINESDAQLGINSITDKDYTSTVEKQVIFARLENKSNTDCYSVTTFELIILSMPALNIQDEYSLCDEKTLTVIAPRGFDKYIWSTGLKDETKITIDSPGEYSLTVSRNYGDIECWNTKYFKVVTSGIATISNIKISEWTDNDNTIHVSADGNGNYEYSLDGVVYQSDPVFNDVGTGLFTVYVKDRNGCGITKEEVVVLSYPKFFTPNSDGVNDVWKINFSYRDPDLTVYIYDRYGKIITSIANEHGWDGKVNNQYLPATDYWFVASRKNGTVYKGHFSLIR